MVFVQVKARRRVVACVAMAALLIALMWGAKLAEDSRWSFLLFFAAIFPAAYIGGCVVDAMTPIWTALGKSFLGACLAGVGWYMVMAAVAALLFGFAGLLLGDDVAFAFAVDLAKNVAFPPAVIFTVLAFFNAGWTAIKLSRKRAAEKED
jgi:MFS family permease